MDRKALRFFLAAWAAVIVLRSVQVFGSYPPLDAWTWMLITVWILAFTGGALAGRTIEIVESGTVAEDPDPEWQNIWVRRLALFAGLGAAFLVYEFAIIRGYGFAMHVSEIRIQEVIRGGDNIETSMLGGIGRLLTPALQLAWVLAMFAWRNVSNTNRAILIGCTAFVFYEQFLFEGGRNYWASLLVQAWIAKMRDPQRKKLNISPTRLIVIGGAVFFVLFVFVDRIVARELRYFFAFGLQAMHHDLEINPNFAEALDSALGAIWFAFGMMWLYMTHGIHQLQVILFDADLNTAYGMHQFSVLALIINKLTGLNVFYDNFVELETPGVYTTGIGAAIIDFGLFGAVVWGALLGFIMTVGLRRGTVGTISWLSLAAPAITTIALFSPLLSMVPNAWLSLVWAWIALPRGAAKGQRQPRASLRS